MTLTVDTESAVAEVLDRSIRNAFETMLGETLTELPRSSLRPHEGNTGKKCLTVVVGLSGTLNGTLGMCLSGAAARCWTKGLIDHDSGEIDQMVIDAVSELGNIVVGGTKSHLEQFELSMGFPSVVRGGVDKLGFNSDMTPVCTAYQLCGETVTTLISLSEA
ncbi:MAG: chemotaxis protein CheX [Planctomycetota bacterium]